MTFMVRLWRIAERQRMSLTVLGKILFTHWSKIIHYNTWTTYPCQIVFVNLFSPLTWERKQIFLKYFSLNAILFVTIQPQIHTDERR